MKKGLKIFGEAGVTAVLSELKQLCDQDVFDPVDPKDLTNAAKRAALQYLM
jgi:hypothetical protein